MIYPVILCGGSGTRLWPLSRKSYPKQFLDLLGTGNTLLQDTVLRLRGLSGLGDAVVVCNHDNRFLVAQQMQDIDADIGAILLEPCARNTAPAVACAAHQALQQDPEALLLVLPADHVIEDGAAFRQAVGEAVEAAADDSLVTFGVLPTHAETGYGYIQRGARQGDSNSYAIASFVEKPDQATAESYLAEGNYAWNSGMFVFRASAYLAALQEHAPDIARCSAAALEQARQDLDFSLLDKSSFAACPSDSIDYAVMEKAEHRVVVSLDAGWSDVGSWSSLWSISEKDAQDNLLQGDVMSLDTRNSLVHAEARLVATLGVQDLVIVDTEDAVLVAHRDKVQDVKQLVAQLNEQQRHEAENHDIVYRPWGSYQSICASDRFQVKKIVVAPGQKLSLQKHHHRAEHWIVVQGTARVTCEERVFTLGEDESTYIPLGHKHRLENPGKIPLELIEVQSGSYLGEDDIVRYDDVYGRQDS